jgi:hypothetical protein
LPAARIIFDLAAEGILKAGGCSLRPLEVVKLPADPQNGHGEGVLLKRSELLSVSLMALPDDADTAASAVRILGRGRFESGERFGHDVKSLLMGLSGHGDGLGGSRPRVAPTQKKTVQQVVRERQRRIDAALAATARGLKELERFVRDNEARLDRELREGR